MQISDSAFRAAGALIDESVSDFEPPTIDGHKFQTGLAPRNFDTNPMYGTGKEFPDELLLDEHDLKQAFADQEAYHSSLLDLREMAGGYLDSLDQNGFGLCWNFSTTKGIMYARERAGLPRIPLSAWYGAGIINKWRDQGGWCEASAAFAVQHGTPRLDLCPKYDREYDTEATKADAATRLLKEFWETSDDKDKRSHQYLSAMARGFSGACDYNHMGHSMAACRIVNFKSLEEYDADDDNSWSMKSGVKGLYRLKGRKARPDACVLFRTVSLTNG